MLQGSRVGESGGTPLTIGLSMSVPREHQKKETHGEKKTDGSFRIRRCTCRRRKKKREEEIREARSKRGKVI